MITKTDLHERFRYDSDRGLLVWKIAPPYKPSFCGRVAGYIHNFGNYRRRYVKLMGRMYTHARLVYIFHYGKIPENIDHIDQDSLNDRIENLRECTKQQNSRNRASGKKGGRYLPKWVQKTVNGKRYRASLCVNKRTRYVGTYDTPEEAYAAAAEYAKNIHGEFFNPGK